MQDLNDKVTGNTLSAAEWNQPASELQTIIEASGQTLSGADLEQALKSLPYHITSAGFFTGSNLNGTITLSAISPHVLPTALRDGMIFSFITTATSGSISGSPTLVLGVFSKTLLSADGTGLRKGFLSTGTLITVRYDLASDQFYTINADSDNPGSVVLSSRAMLEITGNLASDENRALRVSDFKNVFKRKVNSTEFAVPGAGAKTVITPYSLTLDSSAGIQGYYRIQYRFRTGNVASGAILLEYELQFSNAVQNGFPPFLSYSVFTRRYDVPGAASAPNLIERSVSTSPGASGPLNLVIFSETAAMSSNGYTEIDVLCPAGGSVDLAITNNNATDGGILLGGFVTAEAINNF